MSCSCYNDDHLLDKNYSIQKCGDNTFQIHGKFINRIAETTDFKLMQSVLRFYKILKKINLFQKIINLSSKPQQKSIILLFDKTKVNFDPNILNYTLMLSKN